MGNQDERSGGMPWKALVGWGVLALLLVATFLAALGGLNQTLYGAPAFVERYLSAIAHDDIADAAATPGVALDAAALKRLGLPADVSVAMLRPGVVAAGPADVRITGDVTHHDGSHTITASYRLDTAIVETSFEVRPVAPLYGVLHRWRFAHSPLAVVDLTAAHNPTFTVGNLTLDTRARKAAADLGAFTQTAPYLAIAPAAYTFGFDSDLLTAQRTNAVAKPGARLAVTVDTQPTPAFLDRVQHQLDTYLSSCASQKVLNPTDCPFGTEIDDRVTSQPKWSIVKSPKVVLTPGQQTFEMPPTQGTAHISVEVQSLFDGSVSHVEEDRTFTVTLDARIKPDGSIAVQLK